MRANDDIDTILLGEAADWLMRFQSGDDSAETRLAFGRWHSLSSAHAAAWQRAETVLGTFSWVPADIGRRTLNGLAKPDRRRAIKALGLFAIAAPAVWLAWRHEPWAEWGADLHTATGEQKTLELDDGTHIVLNTDSAVDVSFTAEVRRLRLIKGEILVTTASDPSPMPRPFVVQTAQGSIRPMGTRFSVRQLADETHAAVFEGAIEIHTLGGEQTILNAGEYGLFQANRIGSKGAVDNIDSLWEHGMLVARNMPLGELIKELGRYRPGILRCHPAVADMHISGAFPLRNTDESLDLLVKSRPLDINSISRYWVSVVPGAKNYSSKD